jgi:Gram-negative bacterial TonB protein C-terminal
MNKYFAYMIAVVLASAVILHAQQPDEGPFAAFTKQVKGTSHRWAGEKHSLSKMFDDERRRLGDRFETELIKWLEDDPEKHYWVSSFIESDSYLHGNKRLPELSLLIKQQGLSLVQGKSDDQSLGYIIGLSITAAILSDELGLRSLASHYKSTAERLLVNDPSLARHIPAVSEADRRRYDDIKSVIRRGVTTVLGASANPRVDRGDTNLRPLAPITGGILNGKAIKLAMPTYPRAAHETGAFGTVQVRVVIDETGRVIYAKAISGHPDLWKVSEDAASQSEFSPTKLAGQPVKVSGVIQYNFIGN